MKQLHSYFSTGHYRRGSQALTPWIPTSTGDSQGRPNMGNVWKLGCMKKDGKGIWKSNTTKDGWAGPCFWRPTNSGCNRPDEERMKMCFDHFDENGNIVVKTGGKDPKNVCTNVTFDADRIQHGGVPNVNTGTQSCGNELTFALTYEVNFMNDFQLDEEFKLHGCGGSYEGDTLWQGDSTIDCPHNMERLGTI